MKIIKKVLASLAITGMALTIAPFNAIATIGTPIYSAVTGSIARLFGPDRIGTAVAAADAGWTTADTAILASSDDADLVDVLLAAPLAGKTAPILLTDKNTLSPATQTELIKLEVKNVYVVGPISQLVIDQVNKLNGVNTTVLKGTDRIATTTKISSKLVNPQGSFIVGYGALADALSVASYAAANNYAILVANPDGTLPASETAYKGATTYIIGGPTLVKDITGTTRLFGANRFATNLAVLKTLTYKYDHVYVANGTDTHLVDSLVASSLAAKTNSPIVLNDSNGDGLIASNFINRKLGSTSVVTALGGHVLVSDADVAQITDTPGPQGPHTNDNNPIPTYKSNEASPVSSFLSKDEILALTNKEQMNYSTIISLELETWKAHRIADDPASGPSGYIDDGRMVWVEKLAAPNGVDTPGGYYDNATLTITLDAETGTPFESSVNGTLRPGTGHPTGADVAQITTALNSTVGDGSTIDSVTPSVTAVTEVRLNQTTLSLTPGGATGPLVATVFPANATNQAVTWTTSDADVATVVNGVVTPLKTGTAIITATTDDGAKTATCTVTVTPVTSGCLGVTADLSGFTQYYPLLSGKAAPSPTLKVAGKAFLVSPANNTTNFDITKLTTAYNPTWNASFVVAPFNSYPAMSIIPSQGLTINITSSDKNGVITNVDGYTLTSLPNKVTVNVNSSGEVSINTVQLWKAQSGYKVVGYMPGSKSGSTTTLIEENLSTPVNFIGVEVPIVGSSGTQVAAWTLPSTSLPGNFEDFLGFNVNSKGQLQPIVASYFANHSMLAPYSKITSTLAAGVFAPVEAAQVYVGDNNSMPVLITVSSSLNSKTASITAEFGIWNRLAFMRINPTSVSETLGNSQTITLNCMDAYGNPIANQTLYLGTRIPGLWLTQVNGETITESVNMGTTSSPSMQTVNTPVPLFNLGSLASAPAYSSVSVTGLTASNLNNNTSPIVALTTGDDGTVTITLEDGNVNYVANTGSTTTINSYKIDPGAAINQQDFEIFSDSTQTMVVGSILLNWNNPVTGMSLNHTSLSLTVGGAPAVLVASVVPSNATNQDVTWSSSNTNVDVATNGVITPVSAGTATITATTQDGNKTAICIVTVAAP